MSAYLGPAATHQEIHALLMTYGRTLDAREVAQNIAAGNFKAKPGFYCAFCPYRNLCPATEKRLYSIPTAKKVSNRNN